MNHDDNVSRFYNDLGGWDSVADLLDSSTVDASLFEDLRDVSRNYLSKIRLRVNRHITNLTGGSLLDFASGPIQYKEYLTYSRGFENRYCVDFSSQALVDARSKIGNAGKYFVGDYFGFSFPENHFDCSLCIHTLYHIDRDKQVHCVRKLIRETKPCGNIVVLYSNPNSLNRRLRSFASCFGWKSGKKQHDLYFYAYPLGWWKHNFSDTCVVRIETWRLFETAIMKVLIPDNFFGAFILRCFYLLESINFSVIRAIADYPMIILTKK